MAKKIVVNPNYKSGLQYLDTGGGVGLNDIYTGNSPTTITVGGLLINTPIAGLTHDQIIQQMVSAYINPTWTSFTVDITTPLEIGQVLDNTTPRNWTWGSSFNNNVNASSVILRDTTSVGTPQIGITGPDLTAPFTYSRALPVAVTKSVHNATHIFQLSGNNTNAIAITPRTITLTWRARRFVGQNSATTLTEAQIEALSIENSFTNSSYNGTFAFPATAGTYKYFCFPDSMGSPVSFKDLATGFDVPMAGVAQGYNLTVNGLSYYTITITNTLGVATLYRVYRTFNILNGAITIVVA